MILGDRDVNFFFEFKKVGIHGFGILQILDVKAESNMFTLGYD